MNEKWLAERESHVMLRICREYLEMPGLRLTDAQARRLFGLGEEACRRLLDKLVARGFLTRQRSGMYIRLSEGPANLGSLFHPHVEENPRQIA